MGSGSLPVMGAVKPPGLYRALPASPTEAGPSCVDMHDSL